MTKFGPVVRFAALAGLICLSGGAATPAFAGPDEDAVLAQYIGSWSGRGQLQGANTETLVCRLNFTDGNGGKVNYNGRCSVAGASMSVTGTVAYNDAARRYEAVMSSNIAFRSGAVGRRQGNGIIFEMNERNRIEGQGEFDISAQMALQDGDAINVSFRMVDAATGGVTSASVPFSK